MIVEVAVAHDDRPVWWRAQEGPPPASWDVVFRNFTGADTADEWGLAAAIFIARTRRRLDRGPTFVELFTELIPDSEGLPAPIPARLNYSQRVRLAPDFRIYAAIDWKRRGWISWDVSVARSLRVGRAFRELSRARQRGRDVAPTSGAPCGAAPDQAPRPAGSISPLPEETDHGREVSARRSGVSSDTAEEKRVEAIDDDGGAAYGELALKRSVASFASPGKCCTERRPQPSGVGWWILRTQTRLRRSWMSPILASTARAKVAGTKAERRRLHMVYISQRPSTG